MTPPPSTRGKILDVAEQLFGEEGVDRVSVRDVTERAGVNVASINYHFGSKEELIAAVFERRLAPLNAARLKILTEVEDAAGSKGPTVEKILEAFILPALGCCKASNTAGASFAKLMGRCMAETRPEVEALLKEQFEPVAARFQKALGKARPELSRSEIFWRLKFTFGALHHWLMTREKFVPDWLENSTIEEQVGRLIKFTAAGFRG